MAGKAETRILVVRLGAMGDILHTLPAVASLKHSHAGSRLTWVVEERWAPLLEGNPFVDRVVLLRRGSMKGLFESRRELRTERYDFAVDFQGLIKSAMVASASRADCIFGFENSLLRERTAGLFYSKKTSSTAAHVVDRNLDLAMAAGASSLLKLFPIPEGRAEGALPGCDFVLASPLAGWGAKQWPAEHYARLAARLKEELGMPLVVNLPPSESDWLERNGAKTAIVHTSGLAGLIHATRKAAAVVGVDSGPLHLAAALGKPGAAIFGPTDPTRNGPYGDSLKVLRSDDAPTTYKRNQEEVNGSMARITPDEVFEVLRAVSGGHRRPAGCCV